MTLTDLIERLQGTAFPRSADLPYPNIYWATIRKVGVPEVNTYIAGGHTNQALQKVLNWCADTHRFRPTRSDSKVLLRRLLLGDLIENPAAYHDALATAQARGERDIVQGLRDMPAKVWRELERERRVASAAHDNLWTQLAAEINTLEQRHLRY